MPFWLWSYLLAAVGLLGIYLAGRKNRTGWAVGIAAQVLWVAYALATGQSGFLVTAFAYGAMYAKNYRAWGADQPLSHQACDHNCIPIRGGLRELFRSGWVCVRCNEWSRTILPRLCPDCQLGPDQGLDGDCQWCRDAYEDQQREKAIYAGGYDDGHAAASTQEPKP